VSTTALRVAGSHRSRVITAFAAVYLIWGSTYLAIRYAVATIPPFLMGGVRFVLAGTILYAWARSRGAVAPTKAQWRAACLTGVLLLVCGNGAVIWSEQHVASSIVALIVAVVPLWMVLLDWWRPGGKHPRPLVFVGLALGLAGLALLIGPDAVAARHGTSRLDVGAALVPVFGSLFWALGSILTRYAPRPASAPLGTGMQMLVGGAGFLVLSVLTPEARQFDMHAVAASSLAGMLYLITFGALVGFTAYNYLLGASTPAKVSTYAYVNPVVAVILGWAIAGEPLTSRTLLAAAVILAGVAIITLANVPGAVKRSTAKPSARQEDRAGPPVRALGMTVFARAREETE
jgi:drug/metabolite transporter (DMT)-like permease